MLSMEIVTAFDLWDTKTLFFTKAWEVGISEMRTEPRVRNVHVLVGDTNPQEGSDPKKHLH